MRKTLNNTKIPQKTIQLSIGTVNYDVTQTKYLASVETASQRTSASKPHIVRKTNRYQLLRKEHKNHQQIYLAEFLDKLLARRKSYSFQMLKINFLFPDQSFSEKISVNSYDRLFFHDQHIHTMIKIYQTKQMQAKIWAFLNLKNLHKRRKLQKFTEKIETIQHKMIYRTKKSIFNKIHQYSISIKPKPVIKIQRLSPIVTKIQPSQIKNNETIKTERIQRNNYVTRNNIIHTQSSNRQIKIQTTNKTNNQVIRLSEPYQIVRRVELSPGNGMKLIYPTNQQSQQRKYQSRSLPHRTIQHRQYFTKDIKDQISRSRIITNQTKNIQMPRQTIYTTETVKNIQTVKPVNYHVVRPATTTTISSNNYEIRQPTVFRPSFNDYGYLVHTVQGDCTINIYNGNGFQQRQRHRSTSQTRDVRANSNQGCHYNYYQPAIQYSMVHKCCICPHLAQSFTTQHCHSHCMDCSTSHHYSTPHHTSFEINNSKIYDIENRIQYLKSLEELNNKVINHKNFAKD